MEKEKKEPGLPTENLSVIQFRTNPHRSQRPTVSPSAATSLWLLSLLSLSHRVCPSLQAQKHQMSHAMHCFLVSASLSSETRESNAIADVHVLVVGDKTRRRCALLQSCKCILGWCCQVTHRRGVGWVCQGGGGVCSAFWCGPLCNCVM